MILVPGTPGCPPEGDGSMNRRADSAVPAGAIRPPPSRSAHFGYRIICVQRKSAIVLLDSLCVMTASQTWVFLPMCLLASSRGDWT